jgi:hypothetical protein
LMFPALDINGKSFVDSVSSICKPPSTSTPSQAQEAASKDKMRYHSHVCATDRQLSGLHFP